MKKIFLTILITSSIAVSTRAGENPTPAISASAAAPAAIQWTTMSDALTKSTKSKKKILIDFFTDWCGWCKKMDKTTYEDPRVIEVINKYYIPVKFNAESEGPIKYKGKEYALKPSGMRSTHELATFLLNGQMGYPTTTFLGNTHELISNLPGYISAEDMVSILTYFGQDAHLTMTYDEFKKGINK